ncbi:MAG: hypothetical protein WAQ24_01395 [Candidatus Saccharimonadales bacterium]
MELLQLENGAKLELDTQGAYITSLQDASGNDILFPRQVVGEKLRGGIPVCAPIFGPGDVVGLKQHGFARNLRWNVTAQSENSLELSLQNPAEQDENISVEYTGCAMTLQIELETSSLRLGLAVKNNGAQPFVCTPGFHPYFAASDATKASILNETEHSFNTDDLLATQFLDAKDSKLELQIGGRNITLESEACKAYAVWSESPNQYICVEPTVARNLAPDMLQHHLLPAGENRQYNVVITW